MRPPAGRLRLLAGVDGDDLFLVAADAVGIAEHKAAFIIGVGLQD